MNADGATWNNEDVMYRRRVEVPGGYDIETHRAAWSPISGHWESDGRCESDGELWPCPTFLAAPEWVRTLTAHGIHPQDLHMGIVVSPGDTEVSLTCTGCGRFAKPCRHSGRWQSGLTPCEGDRFCWTCTEAYLDARSNPVRIGADGRPAGRELDYITPMSASRFSEGDRQAVRDLRRRRPAWNKR